MTDARLLPLRIAATELPGRTFHDVGFTGRTWPNVHVGVQRGDDVLGRTPGDAEEAVWDLALRLAPARDGGLEVRGPWVHGPPGDRFLYLSWGTLEADGSWNMFRRLKLWPGDAGRATLAEAATGGRGLELRLGLTDARGTPLCGGRAVAAALCWRVAQL